MNLFKFTLIGLLLSLGSFAQSGADPAVTSRNLRPAPINGGVGSPFSMTFTIGNFGTVPIDGSSAADRMGFSLCLTHCAPTTANPLSALSGDLLAYYDVNFNTVTGCFDGIQKAGVSIDDGQLNNVIVSLTVTQASSSTAFNDIGGSVNIAPSPNSKPQPIDNDFAAIYTHTTVTALPVSLVRFSAQAQADRSVLVSWQTAWERANQGYLVERSKDLIQFETVGEVKDVAGTSSSLNTYQYVDASPYRGTSYYRLRQLDQDGRSQTYPAESVVMEGRYGVYPNPVAGHSFTLELDEPTTAVLHLVDAVGRSVSLSRSDLTEGSIRLTPGSKLTAGMYLLRVEERGTIRNHRLIVP